jgi:membrane fusion protein, multidrug efflux system
MRRSYLIAASLSLGIAGWIVSGQLDGASTPHRPSSAASDMGATPPLPRVRVRASTARETVNELVLFGRTEAERQVDIKAETVGRVVAVGAAKGQTLGKGGVIVRLAMDDRQARLEEAKARLAHERIAFDAARRLSLKEFRSKVQLAEANSKLEAAKAALARIQMDVAHTIIRAPFDGVLDDRPAEVGDYVAIGTVVARVVDLDPILVVGSVSERDVARIDVGAKAWARLVTGQRLEGRVRYVSRMGDDATRTFRVEVAVPNPGSAVAEGLTTELRLPTARVRAHHVSPAVLTLSGEGVVGVKAVDAGGRVVFHPVRLIADDPEGAWLAGLPDNVTLITVGHEFVRSGQRVRPEPEDGDPGSQVRTAVEETS